MGKFCILLEKITEIVLYIVRYFSRLSKSFLYGEGSFVVNFVTLATFFYYQLLSNLIFKIFIWMG